MSTKQVHEGIKFAVAATVAAMSGMAFSADVVLTGGETPVTIALSGSTAMRNFTTSANFSFLAPNTNITLNSGVGGAPVTYYAASNSTGVQLAAKDVSGAFTVNPTLNTPVTSAQYFGARIEWHEQGSVEGINEMVNDQIGYTVLAGPVALPLADRNPRTTPVPTTPPVWINQNTYVNVGTALGHTLATSDYNTYINYATSGKNNQGGLNRIQMAISDVSARQGYAIDAVISADYSVNRVAGAAGFGKGNQALAAGNGANSRKQLNSVNVLNMGTNKNDPATGAAYAEGAWNNAGLDNLTNNTVAITATLPVANPGTGLVRVNRTDAQWLSTTGRLANGADFNSSTRDVNSGTLNVFALNTGVDPSYVVGENDDGSSGGGAQDAIGTSIKFSGKLSGGSALRPTVQNSRMGFGHLSISDYRNGSGGANNGNRPLRALDYRDDADDLSNGSNSYGDPSVATSSVTQGSNTFAVSRAGFSPANAYTIVNGNYVIWQNQTYVTVKDPTNGVAKIAAWKNADLVNRGLLTDAQAWSMMTDLDTGIKGDNSGTDVADIRANILNSVTTFPPPASLASPADGLIAQSFILPQLMSVKKDSDGINTAVSNSGLNGTLQGQFLGSSLATNFNVTNPATVTEGSASSRYGNVTPAQGAIEISAQNYLFGDFDQDGDRDFADVKAAIVTQQNLALVGTDMFVGAAASNNLPVSTTGLPAGLAAITGHDGTAGPKKGDLIVKGDFNSDGIFNGRDLYLLGRGAALADNSGTDSLTVASGTDFGDQLRKGVLLKNAALEYLQTNTNGTQKGEASVDGGLAFEHRDVNRDGIVNFYDAAIVDGFNGRAINNMTDQLSATVATGQLAKGTTFVGVGGTTDPTTDGTTARKPISLVDVEQNDDININQSDVTSVNSQLAGAGTDTWAAGTSYKTGSNTIAFNRTSSTVTLGAGASLSIAAGTVENQGADVFTSGVNSIDVITGATGKLKISSGSNTTIAHITGTGTVESTGTGSKLTAKFGIQQNTATLTNGGKIEIAANGLSTGVTSVKSLNIDATSTLELHDNDLVVDYAATPLVSPYATIIAKVKSGLPVLGFGGDGTGIASAEVQAQGAGSVGLPGTMLGVVDGDPTGGLVTSLSGFAIANPSTSVLVKYTWRGDANLDGVVNGSDYALADTGFSGGGTGWFYGDMNYDGVINGSDYALIDTGFSSQTGPLPEPATLGLLGLGAMSLLRRRRTA